MKILSKIILTILFVPFFVVFLATTSIRFQLLNQNFYINSFNKYDVYQKTSDNLNSLIKDSATTEGASSSEIKVYSSLLTPDNLKDFTQNNIKNIFAFLNSKDKELIVYVPLNKIPASILPFGFVLKGNEVPLSTLMSYFGRPGVQIDPLVLQRAQMTTTASLFLWAISLVLIIAIIFSQIKMTPHGKRFISPGITLITASLFSLLGIVAILLTKTSIEKEWAMSMDPAQILFGPIVFSLVSSITTLWIYISSVATLLGVILFFLKKEALKKH